MRLKDDSQSDWTALFEYRMDVAWSRNLKYFVIPSATGQGRNGLITDTLIISHTQYSKSLEQAEDQRRN